MSPLSRVPALVVPAAAEFNVTKFACVVVDGDTGEFPSTGLLKEGAVGQRGGMWLLLLVR